MAVCSLRTLCGCGLGSLDSGKNIATVAKSSMNKFCCCAPARPWRKEARAYILCYEAMLRESIACNAARTLLGRSKCQARTQCSRAIKSHEVCDCRSGWQFLWRSSGPAIAWRWNSSMRQITHSSVMFLKQTVLFETLILFAQIFWKSQEHCRSFNKEFHLARKINKEFRLHFTCMEWTRSVFR